MSRKKMPEQTKVELSRKQKDDIRDVEKYFEKNHPLVKLTLKAEGKEAGHDAIKTFRALGKIRGADNLKIRRNKGKLVIKADIRRRIDISDIFKPKKGKTVDKYTTPDGMLLTVTGNGDGEFDVNLEENLERPDGRDKLESLIVRIGTLSTIKSIKRKVISGKKGGGEKRLVAELKISDIEKFEGLEAERLRQIILYRNMQETLETRIDEIAKQKRPFMQNMLDDIEHWTHLTVGDICHRRNIDTLNPKFYTIKQKYKAELKLLKIADFLRELYGLIEIKTKAEYEKNPDERIVTRKDILSDKKPHDIAKQRHIMMYIIKNKFPYLSSTAIGIMFGPVGDKKEHATVLLAQKLFDGDAGLQPRNYERIDDAEGLYKDALEKYETAHKKTKVKTK